MAQDAIEAKQRLRSELEAEAAESCLRAGLVRVRRGNWKGQEQSPKTAAARRTVPLVAPLPQLLRAHAARNYGAIVALEGTRVTVLSVYRRPAEDLARALDNYLSMQPDPIECASKALVACVDHPELIDHYIPAAIDAISELPQQPHIAALLARLEEVQSRSTAP